MRVLERRFRAMLILSVAVAAPLSFSSPVRADKAALKAYPPDLTPKEIELGKKSVEQLEKDPRVKLLDAKDPKNKVLLDKLNDMAAELGKVSARPLIRYNIKVIEDKDVNAFTLPGGHIYLSSGLIALAASDDEIAAVIGHEIGHNAHMHVLREQEKTKPLQWVGLAAILAMLKGGQNGMNIAQMAPYILTGIVNKYSVAYEKEADIAAIDEMQKTAYNPSAMVTFMQRLADEEKRQPQVELGIYRSHPVSSERVQSALDTIKKAGLPYTPRAVTGGKEATFLEKDRRASVMWDTAPLIQYVIPTPISASPNATSSTQNSVTVPDKTTPVKTAEITTTDTAIPTPVKIVVVPVSAAGKRAQTTAARLNALMRDNLKMYEISVSASGDDAVLTARGQEIARATAADVTAPNGTTLALAQSWKANLQRLFWKESLIGAM